MFKKLNRALAVVLTLTMVISLFTGLPPKAQAEETTTYEELPAPPIMMPAAVNPDYPQMEKPVVEAHSNGDGTGYLDISWDPVEGAEKYQVILFNGSYHSYWDVPATETTWTTKGKGMFPTPDQIEAGQVDFLRNGTGDEFALSPNELYAKAYELNGGLDYRNSVDYYVRVAAVYENGASPISYATLKQFDLETPKNIQATGYNLPTDGNVQLIVDWEPVPYAKGYYLHLWDGKSFERIDLGNSTSFDSEIVKVWPSSSMGAWELNGGGESLKSSPTEMYLKNNDDEGSEEYRFYVTAYDEFGRTSEHIDVIEQKISISDFLSQTESLSKQQAIDIINQAEEGIFRNTVQKPVFNDEGEEIGEKSVLITREIEKINDDELVIDMTMLEATPTLYSGEETDSNSFTTIEENSEIKITSEGETFVNDELIDPTEFESLTTSLVQPFKLVSGGISFLTYYKETSRNRYYLKSYQRPSNIFLDRGMGGMRQRYNVSGYHVKLGNFKSLARSIGTSRKVIRTESQIFMAAASLAIVTFYTVVSFAALGSFAGALALSIFYEYGSAKSDMNEAYRELLYIK